MTKILGGITMKSKNTMKKIGIITCAVLITATLAGCGMSREQSTGAQNNTVQQTESETTKASTDTLTNAAEYIDEAQAKTIALEHAGKNEADVSHMHCKLDYDDGVAEYEVEFWDGTTEYDYEINAVSGEIIGYDYDMESYDARPVTTTNSNVSAEYIDEAQAKAIALEHAGKNEANVSHMHCKLDYDDGVAEYEVEFWDGTTEYDYEINAVSGEIIVYDYDMESYDARPVTTTDSNVSTEYIDEVQAKTIALEHAGVTESEAGVVKCEFDFDDGYAEYEIEWEIGRMEYEYTISATDGTIFEHDVEYDD